MQRKDVIADTYAVAELLTGNPSYRASKEKDNWMLTEHTLAEVYFLLLRTYGPSTAQKLYLRWKQRVQPTPDQAVFIGMNLKLKNPRENLSYADCIGWGTAQVFGIPFLTGDIKFKNKKGVIWVQ